MIETLLGKPVVIGLAILGAAFSTGASLLRVRGKVSEGGARKLNYAGYAFMAASMILFVLAGLTGAKQ